MARTPAATSPCTRQPAPTNDSQSSQTHRKSHRKYTERKKTEKEGKKRKERTEMNDEPRCQGNYRSSVWKESLFKQDICLQSCLSSFALGLCCSFGMFVAVVFLDIANAMQKHFWFIAYMARMLKCSEMIMLHGILECHTVRGQRILRRQDWAKKMLWKCLRTRKLQWSAKGHLQRKRTSIR